MQTKLFDLVRSFKENRTKAKKSEIECHVAAHDEISHKREMRQSKGSLNNPYNNSQDVRIEWLGELEKK